MTWSDWYRFKSYIRSALWIVALIAILFEHMVVREAVKEIGSSVPWIGFPVGYAI